MDDLDLSVLPHGQLGWRKLIEQIKNDDDRIERYFLEKKGGVDLNTKEGQAKVAKFILGAANRSPELAAKRFGGYALMVLGVEEGATPGIPGFEAMDLSRTVAKFTGTPGPLWEFERVDVGGGRDVIIVMVDPPDARKQPWSCHSDGPEKLVDGRIYIRGDGDTREAKGVETRDLINRGKSVARPKAELCVDVLGSARSYAADDALLEDYVKKERTRLLKAYPEPAKPPQTPKGSNTNSIHNAFGALPDMSKMLSKSLALNGLGGSSNLYGEVPDERTYEQYRSQIFVWGDKVKEAWPDLLDEAAAIVWPGVAIKVSNLTRIYLDEVTVRLHIEGPVEAMDNSRSDEFRASDYLPAPPRKWGPTRKHPDFVNMAGRAISYAPAPLASPYGIVGFENGGSADIEVKIPELPPTDSYETADDIVLILRDPSVTELHGTWQAFVKGHDDVYEGDFKVEVESGPIDFTNGLRDMLLPSKTS